MNKPSSIWQQHWRLCWQSSKPYRLGQALTFVLYLLFYLIYTLPFLQDAEPQLLQLFFARYLLEATGFIVLSHFLVRPPLRIHYQRGFSLGGVLQLFGWLSLAAFLLALISTFASAIPALAETNMQQVTLVNKDSVDGLQMQFSLTTLITMLWLMHFSLFLFWSLVYLGWQMRQSRKALEQEMQQARLQQLTNQLSPHFLFNTLNSIRALIFEDQHKAADTLTQLSELFRVHLQAHLRPTSSLQEEWQLCQTYLHIEQIRLEQRLQLTVNIDDSLWQQPLPTLMLLTLLENAIKHGISPNPEPGFIELTAQKLDASWQLSLRNSVGAQSNQSSTGTGLRNCRKRLQLMHGDKARIELEQSSTFFHLTLELPYATHPDR
ncbi:sensor histidine kinase [Alkalimonas amylolytica]|uniref:Histidine kinase n=1 Tax=Alkalimonas amylolytica TaxID=152573 RepID=A0A1H4CG54_ALKAM|nr:histidine kinase [Alkalimonas amylolytica]SEA59415.1 Histidine kinase [Alkalimonas amylolytica]